MGSQLFNIPIFTKTDEFRQEAIKFNKTKVYCQYPKGTIPFDEYWDNQTRLCKEGMTNSAGIYITGPHYFYLNFIQILAADETTGRKLKQFPRFIDVDYDYFRLIEQARHEKKGLILLKPRRMGFSYKSASLITHEYNFFRDSRSYVGAFLGELSEQTMGFTLENLNFLDKNTEWRKQRNPDTRDFVKARYKSQVDGVDSWRGYMSEIQSITFKNNPFASVGKSASLFLWEEAGKFENLVNSFNITEPCWKDGSNMTGLPIVQGTGGDMEGGTRDFSELFYNPSKYGFISLTNTWDAGKDNTDCGWFIPATRGRLGEFKGQPMVDKDGNSNELLAMESIMETRELKAKSGDPQAIKDSITQYPLTPAEGFLRSKGSVFPVLELAEQLSKLETQAKYKDAGQNGEFYFDKDNLIKFRISTDCNPIVEYPLRQSDNKNGCVVIWEHPELENGHIPHSLYIAGCDPYDQDKSGTGSLGSIFIYKRFYRADKTHDLIVAEYTGRPNLADDFYETCRRLLIYYNAECLYENQLKGLKGYFEQKNCLHYLYETPQILNDIVKDSKVRRGYGIHMNRGNGGSTGIKDQCEIYLKQWLLGERQTSELPGEQITTLNLHTILSPALLKELIAYNYDDNFDRCISFMLCILQSKELHKIHVEDTTKPSLSTDPFFQRTLFKKTTNYSHLS
jgi:hypothetical protein